MKNIKLVTCIFIVFVIASGKLYAQEPGDLVVGFEAATSLHRSKGLKTMEINTDVGFNITNWLAITGKYDVTAGLFDAAGVKSYELTQAGGARFTFRVLQTNYGVLSLNAAGGSTIGNYDWEYTYYSAGCNFAMGKGKIKPALGVGLKYFDTRKKCNLDNYLRFYFSFSIWLD